MAVFLFCDVSKTFFEYKHLTGLFYTFFGNIHKECERLYSSHTYDISNNVTTTSTKNKKYYMLPGPKTVVAMLQVL